MGYKHFSYEDIWRISSTDSLSWEDDTIKIKFGVGSKSEASAVVLWRDAENLHGVESLKLGMDPGLIDISFLFVGSVENRSEKSSVNRTLVEDDRIFLVVSSEAHNCYNSVHS